MYFGPEYDSPCGMPPNPQAIGSLPLGTEILLRATVIGRSGDQVVLVVKKPFTTLLVPATAEVNG